MTNENTGHSSLPIASLRSTADTIDIIGNDSQNFTPLQAKNLNQNKNKTLWSIAFFLAFMAGASEAILSFLGATVITHSLVLCLVFAYFAFVVEYVINQKNIFKAFTKNIKDKIEKILEKKKNMIQDDALKNIILRDISRYNGTFGWINICKFFAFIAILVVFLTTAASFSSSLASIGIISLSISSWIIISIISLLAAIGYGIILYHTCTNALKKIIKNKYAKIQETNTSERKKVYTPDPEKKGILYYVVLCFVFTISALATFATLSSWWNIILTPISFISGLPWIAGILIFLLLIPNFIFNFINAEEGIKTFSWNRIKIEIIQNIKNLYQGRNWKQNLNILYWISTFLEKALYAIIFCIHVFGTGLMAAESTFFKPLIAVIITSLGELLIDLGLLADESCAHHHGQTPVKKTEDPKKHTEKILEHKIIRYIKIFFAIPIIIAYALVFFLKAIATQIDRCLEESALADKLTVYEEISQKFNALADNIVLPETENPTENERIPAINNKIPLEYKPIEKENDFKGEYNKMLTPTDEIADLKISGGITSF